MTTSRKKRKITVDITRKWILLALKAVEVLLSKKLADSCKMTRTKMPPKLKIVVPRSK